MADHLPPHPIGYDKNDVHIPTVVISTVVSIIFVVVSAIALDTYFVWKREQMKWEEAQKIDERLTTLRAQEAAALSSYGPADTTGTYFRIPVARAESLVIAQQGLPSGARSR